MFLYEYHNRESEVELGARRMQLEAYLTVASTKLRCDEELVKLKEEVADGLRAYKAHCEHLSKQCVATADADIRSADEGRHIIYSSYLKKKEHEWANMRRAQLVCRFCFNTLTPSAYKKRFNL